MAVLARFWVQKVTKQVLNANGEVAREVILAPVIRHDQGDSNVNWSKYTPSGEIKLTVTAQPAGEWFEDRLGKDIAITFDDPID